MVVASRVVRRRYLARLPARQFRHYIVTGKVTDNNARRGNLIRRQFRTLLRSSVSRGAPLFIVLAIVYFAVTTLFAASRGDTADPLGPRRPRTLGTAISTIERALSAPGPIFLRRIQRNSSSLEVESRVLVLSACFRTQRRGVKAAASRVSGGFAMKLVWSAADEVHVARGKEQPLIRRSLYDKRRNAYLLNARFKIIFGISSKVRKYLPVLYTK